MKNHIFRHRSILRLMRFTATGLGCINIDVINNSAYFALVLKVNFHNLDLFLPVFDELFLVFGHQVFSNAQKSHFLRLPHFNDHAV